MLRQSLKTIRGNISAEYFTQNSRWLEGHCRILRVWPFTPRRGILKPGQLAYANQKFNSLSHWSGVWGRASDWAHQQYPHMYDTLWKLKRLNLGPCPNHFWPQPLTGFVITLPTYHTPKKKKKKNPHNSLWQLAGKISFYCLIKIPQQAKMDVSFWSIIFIFCSEFNFRVQRGVTCDSRLLKASKITNMLQKTDSHLCCDR